VRGRDPKLRNTYVAVGAHHDHIGFSKPVDHDSIRTFNTVVRQRGADDRQPTNVSDADWTKIHAILDSLHRVHGVRLDSINNGADDDGSGSVIELELAEFFAKAATKPNGRSCSCGIPRRRRVCTARSISPTIPRCRVIPSSRRSTWTRWGAASDRQSAGGPNALVIIGSRRLSTELGDLAESVNKKETRPFTSTMLSTDGDRQCVLSERPLHVRAVWNSGRILQRGAWHIDYHMVSDEPQYIAYDRMTRIARYIRDVIGATADLTHRPAVDKPKPDPDGVCRQ